MPASAEASGAAPAPPPAPGRAGVSVTDKWSIRSFSGDHPDELHAYLDEINVAMAIDGVETLQTKDVKKLALASLTGNARRWFIIRDLGLQNTLTLSEFTATITETFRPSYEELLSQYDRQEADWVASCAFALGSVV